MSCLFCQIIKKEIPSELIYEDDVAIGVLDIYPKAPGHSMVLPKIHIENILELDESNIGPVFNAVKKTTQLLFRVLAPDGFTIGINHGKYAGQVIEHLHIHIIPRYKEDGGGSIHSIVNNPPKESLEEIKQRIQKVDPLHNNFS